MIRVAAWMMSMALACLLTSCATSAPSDTAELLIADAVIVDGTGRDPFRGSILVKGGRIEAVIAAGGPLPPARRTINAAGGTVIPGLWDMHVHLAEDRQHESMLDDFVRFGVTSVRDAGGHLDILRQWDRQARSGQRVAPMIHSVGPTLNGPGDDSYHVEVRSAAQAEAAVADLQESGVTQVKVHQRLSPEALRAIIAAARNRQMQVFGHIAAGVSPLQACQWGMEGYEHLSAVMGAYVESHEGVGLIEAIEFLRSPASQPFYDCVRASGGYINPTLITLRYLGRAAGGETADLAERQIRALLPTVRRLAENGVTIIAGSDVGLGAANMPAGHSLVEELALLRESGLTWPQVIRSATLNAAAVMDVADRRGSVEVGKAADLVLYRDDPFSSPQPLLSPERVWVDGREVFQRP